MTWKEVRSNVTDLHGSVRSGPLTLYGRSPFAHSICVQPHEDRLSNPLIEVGAFIREDLPLDCVCDMGYRVLWPGKPTVWTAVEDYTWFEAFSEEGCATGIACTPAPHLQRKER